VAQFEVLYRHSFVGKKGKRFERDLTDFPCRDSDRTQLIAANGLKSWDSLRR